MRNVISNINQLKPYQKIIALVELEVLVMLLSGIGFYELHAAPYFNIGVDLIYWFFYLLGIPQFVLANAYVALVFDISLLLCLGFLFFNIENRVLAIISFLMLMLFYVTITGYLGHRNFQSGFVLVLIPLMWGRAKSRQFVFEGLRYWLLLFYCSSAILKLSSSAIWDLHHFSTILQNQFLPYYVENQLGWRTHLNQFLLSHPTATMCLFLVGMLMELCTIVGFFTKKFDRYLGITLIVFHVGNWMLMDIAPIGHFSILFMFFISQKMIFVEDY